MTITIAGREYEGVFYSLAVFQKAIAYEGKLGTLQQKLDENPDDEVVQQSYAELWLKFCALQLKGDVSALAVDVISPEEAQELRFFFDAVLVEKMRKLNAGQKSFADSLRSTEQQTAS